MNLATDALADDLIPHAPWYLRGAACLSLFAVPLARLPPAHPAIPYARLGRRALVAVVWARYRPGGTLAYDELAVALLTRASGLLRPAGTITHIWVSDPRSAVGGRQLWHIPKQLGAFEHDEDGGELAGRLVASGERVASLRFEGSFGLPGRVGLGAFVIQPGAGGPVRTRCRVSGRMRCGRAQWTFAGPLGFLRGCPPLVSFQLDALEAVFGS